MKILYISHTFPPTFGGLERQNYYLSGGLKKHAEVKIIANTKGKKWLPIFLPVTFLRSLFLMLSYDVCLLGSGVLSPIGAVLKIIYPRKKFFSTVHGLDITFVHNTGILSKIYRYVNVPSMKKIDKLFMVGNHTIEEAEKIGISRDHCVFIPNGIIPEELAISCLREDMTKVLGIDIAGKKVILRIARFVPHKGVEWFLRNVLPKLPEDYFFVAVGGRVSTKAAGNKDTYPACEKAIRELDLENRARLITDIDEKSKLVLLNCADLFISPNVKVVGYMEGFGITAIEGAACGRVVLASDIEGLKDAIIDGKNGFSVEHENAEAWISKIKEVLTQDNFRAEFGQKARQYVLDNFTWDKIALRYLEEIKKIIDA
ncbi:MAG: glycosyltransferase family 4 protein [Parcubacteria group bacterium]|jgi:phosphatidylinositol alpha-1,6-mannosyltransferase